MVEMLVLNQKYDQELYFVKVTMSEVILEPFFQTLQSIGWRLMGLYEVTGSADILSSCMTTI